jgi:hypothetical protein
LPRRCTWLSFAGSDPWQGYDLDGAVLQHPARR